MTYTRAMIDDARMANLVSNVTLVAGGRGTVWLGPCENVGAVHGTVP